MKTAIVNKETLEIVKIYAGALNITAFTEYQDSSKFKHIEYDDSVLGEHILAEQDALDVIHLVSDVLVERNNKLQELRNMRNDLLIEVDYMCNELALDLRSDKQAVKLYRKSLLDITDNYKDSQGKANSNIDSVNLKDSSFWPSKPLLEE